MKKGLTLVELIIAISLLGVVVLGAISIDSFGRGLFSGTDKRTTLLNELSLTLDNIAKDIQIAIGDINDPGIKNVGYDGGSNAWRMRMRQDVNGTPENYADDKYVAWFFYLDGSGRIMRDSGPVSGDWALVDPEQFSSYSFIDLGGAQPFSISYSNGVVEINNLALRYDPAEVDDPRLNPTVTTTDLGAAQTVLFSSNTQSLN